MGEDDRIARALGYPYARPDGSYLLTREGIRDLPEGHSLQGRVPILACGSNGSPEQLLRKFGHSESLKMPVTAARLENLACTYSAHFSGYGSMAATLSRFPGCVSSVHITWLTGEELERMHETEAVGVNYFFAELRGLSLTCERMGPMNSIQGYISRRGSYLLDGEPVPLAGIPAEGLTVRARDQREIQSIVREKLAPDLTLEAFVLQNVEDADLRSTRTRKLAETTRLFDHQDHSVLLPEGPGQ